MPANGMKKPMPSWALPVVVLLGVLLLAFVGWKAFTGSNDSAGPPMAVHPGMVDFRKEFQNGNVGHHRR